jgi:hypothetical protein
MMARNLAWRLDGRLAIIVHGIGSPTNLEWQRFLVDAVSSTMRPDTRVVVLSRGGAPDGHQRQAMAAALGSRPRPVAMLTDKVMVRTAIAAMRLFNPAMKAFATKDFKQASEFLGLTVSESERATRLLTELENELGENAAEPSSTRSGAR